MNKLSIIFVCMLLSLSNGEATFTVILDPGHGGVYNNAVDSTGKILEKHEVLKIAKKVAQLLGQHGINVILTRSGDYALDEKNLINDLIKRVAFIEKEKADIFISLHLNLDTNDQVSGYELYVPLAENFSAASYELAQTLHYALTKAVKPVYGGNLGNLNLVDRGIRAARFNVLMRATKPAVLIELGYLSHVPTAQGLKRGDLLTLFAQAVTEGILIYAKEYGKRVPLGAKNTIGKSAR